MEILATLLFAGLKLLAYIAFLRFIAIKPVKLNIYAIAILRLIAGVCIGMILFALFSEGRSIIPAYISVIFLGRILLWWMVFHLFYDITSNKQHIKYTLGGVAVSYVIDIPAVMGAITIIGGIC